ncbi:hypothetical protein PINS_up008885 [Pythium insidiosum]|nr:hypothetical protein PINS_up008885 [Pythium insidiosum]
MDDDLWRADGSFRGMQGGDGGRKGGKRGGGGSGPQFTRVIPKFLQKFHDPNEVPAIQTKFLPPPQPEGADDDEEELDDVQKQAIEEYMKKQEEKRSAKEENDEGGADAIKTRPTSKARQRIAEIGGKAPCKTNSTSNASKETTEQTTEEEKKKKKRKRAGDDVKALKNRKLLSFSMDDDDA